MTDYRLEKQTFKINNYNHKRPFSSFLPGIAGKSGIPLWAFYVNRGQGISGFGLQDKNHPIMAFTPANKAYESVSTSGFRTFVKIKGQVYEPFHVDNPFQASMDIDKDAFAISETHLESGLEVTVKYFGLPEEPLAGLVRKVTFKNTSQSALSFEALDGLAEILPAGIANDVFKSLSNIMSSWITVEHLDDQLGYFKLRSSTSDSSEVKAVTEGHFYLAVMGNERIKPVVDPKIIFCYNTAKTTPVGFLKNDLKTLKEHPQVTTNQLPCAFVPVQKTLEAGEEFTLFALVGHVRDYSILKQRLSLFTPDYFKEKETISAALIETLTEEVSSKTALPLFDEYIKQCYLDNILRGGYPVQLGGQTYHLYSRRHGDLERDYNFFSLAPEFYSQGNGNFRDVCQNRRLDTVIHPEVKDFNVYHFASLIQLDGYNPLSVNGIRFKVKNPKALMGKRPKSVDEKTWEAMLKEAFSPGQIMHRLVDLNLTFKDAQGVLNEIMKVAEAQIEANFGEGYWVDHFTYILDLIESYEAIYPDTIQTFLFEESKYRYFDSPVSVKPLAEKKGLNADQKVRQYHSLRHPDEAKQTKLNLNMHQPGWVQLNGQDYTSNLFEKLLILILNKHANLDPLEYGIEMEAEKPGWNDAMNGLPGIFGSGVSETIELLRLIRFLSRFEGPSIHLPVELRPLFESLRAFPDYKKRVKVKEDYRESIRFGLKGDLVSLHFEPIKRYFESLSERLQKNLQALEDDHHGLLPSFLYYEATSEDTYQLYALPHFLEAPARYLKLHQKEPLKSMHQKILKSKLYDPNLNIYKTSIPLKDAPDEIGRIKAFTEGWLERESNFLHMTYKYILGLLKAGLYEEYYEALNTNLVCFMDPSVYGRSPLENSSFIVPSNNPDPSIHGQGFFARLSGSTVEALHMWFIMMTGGKPFSYENGQLKLNLHPKLHASYFDQDNAVEFKLFHQTTIRYENPSRISTYEDCEINDYLCEDHEGKQQTYDVLEGEVALKVREGHFKKITILISKIGGKQ